MDAEGSKKLFSLTKQRIKTQLKNNFSCIQMFSTAYDLRLFELKTEG